MVSDDTRVFLTMKYKGNVKLLDSDWKTIKKALSNMGIKDVYFTKLDSGNIVAFAEWNSSEVSKKVKQVQENIPSTEVLKAEILTPA